VRLQTGRHRPSERCYGSRSPGALRRKPILTAEQLAQVIIQSIDRHGLRGLIYEADGMTDVVMHGKVDMVEVAKDVLAAMTKD
jgi:hypothetical protein